ncbi:unnamed protein product [Spirodela intermedia]|uniref:Uncharacterized protein n=1 Tax=Spirodela intermedia TaxID=51605 RepID=A0A7I8JL86_SPIIN|nr:unnamed protein product [Spirodela intermedia]CAA6670936.1 unnamed protein product [Spirodela intermedia]
MRKDGSVGGAMWGGGGAAGVAPFSFSCLDISSLHRHPCFRPLSRPPSPTFPLPPLKICSPALRRTANKRVLLPPIRQRCRALRSDGRLPAGVPKHVAVVRSRALRCLPHVFGKPWFKCEWVSNNPNATTIRAKAYKMLPDWGYGRVYTVVRRQLHLLAGPNATTSAASSSCTLTTPPPHSPKPPGSYDESRFHPPFNSHFVFHDAGGVSPEVRECSSRGCERGRATGTRHRVQEEYDGYYYKFQFLVVNDCLQHDTGTPPIGPFYFDVDDEWGFEKLVFWNSITRARNAFATGVHMSENVVGKALHTRRRRRSDTTYPRLPLIRSPTSYDDSMQRIAGAVKRFGE